jgi:hypothetical protein
MTWTPYYTALGQAIIPASFSFYLTGCVFRGEEGVDGFASNNEL